MRIWTLTLVLLLCACARPPRGSVESNPARNAPAPTAKAPATESTTKRYDLEQEGKAAPTDVEFEEDRLKAPEDTAAEGFDVGEPRSADEQREAAQPTQQIPAPAKDPNAPRSVQVLRGFRVQLAALSSSGEAETARREAASRLGVAVYVDFEAPLYKVRAGDFVDRADAVALQTRARGYGYPEAWVIATEVRVSAP